MKERKNKELSSKDLSELVAKGMIEKKGLDIAILDLRNVKNSINHGHDEHSSCPEC